MSPRPNLEYGELDVAVDCAVASKAIKASKIVIKILVCLIIIIVYGCI